MFCVRTDRYVYLNTRGSVRAMSKYYNIRFGGVDRVVKLANSRHGIRCVTIWFLVTADRQADRPANNEWGIKRCDGGRGSTR